MVLFLCHFWPWAFIHNIQLLCPHGLMLLQRSRQGVRRPEFSFKFLHNLFRPQRCQQWHLLSPYFTISSEQKQWRQQIITHRHLPQASRFAAQRRKKIFWERYQCSSKERFLSIWSTKSTMGYVPLNSDVFLVLYSLNCLPKVPILINIHPPQRYSWHWHFKLQIIKDFGNQDF